MTIAHPPGSEKGVRGDELIRNRSTPSSSLATPNITR
jgi:hypothetical protein